VTVRAGRPAEPPSPLTAIGSAAAPPVPPDTSASPRRWRELDGHRGIAVVGIVVFTVYQFCNVQHFLYRGTLAYTVLNSLDAMVPWLFVLSAFLLFEPIARSAIEAPQTIAVRGFLTRRAVRLLPLYYVSVLIVWFSRQQTLPGDWRDLLEHLTFTQVFDEKRIFYTIGPAWAISVEVLFCLLLATIMIGLKHLCRRITGRRQRISVLVITISLLAALSLAWNAWSFSVVHRPTTGAFTTWFGPLPNLADFAVGMAVAVLVATRTNPAVIRPGSRWLLRLAGVSILCTAFATRQANTWTGVYFPTACAIGFGCLTAAATLGPPDRWSRALSRRTLLWLGTISYSIYVWHEPIVLALRHSHDVVRQAYGAFVVDTVVVVTLSIVAGWVSYLLIQRPTRQLEAIMTPASSRRHVGPKPGRRSERMLRLKDPSERSTSSDPPTTSQS
jgi:peptidoglycan/LPS O-acetylase OafA/YrhL